MNPEVNGERDGGDSPLEDHHGLLLGAAVALFIICVLFPVSVAVRVPVKERVVSLASLRVNNNR